MRTKKILKLADRVFYLWVIHYLLYNLWYGFNMKPMSDNEVMHDTISTWVLTLVLIIHFTVLLRIIRHYVDKNMEDK
jgi:hypothetical protein